MAYLYRTANFSSSNATSAVLSFWIKKTKNDTLQGLFLGWSNASNYTTCYVNTDNTIYYKEKNGGTQYETRITSSARKFRDLNAWMHFVFQWDYTQATASNRIKVWINGELQTWENTGNLPPQNYSLRLKSSDFRIGNYTHAGSNYYTWQGLMSHVHFIDDAPYDTYSASTFGSTDSTTGEWKIKADPQIATNNYGSQGFFILKDDNLGTDRSGKGNNLTTSGTLTKTEDNPSNVFATWNPLQATTAATYDFSAGNTRMAVNDAAVFSLGATLAATTGKYYMEMKWVQQGGNGSWGMIPIDTDINNRPRDAGVGWNQGDNAPHLLGSIVSGSWGGSIGTNDIIQLAMDLDNGAFYFGKNGTYLNSGNPTSGSSKTGAVDFSGTSLFGKQLTFAIGKGASGTDGWNANFGNGYFEQTAVSSAGTNASGNGIFEYNVPAGFTALSTKGLNL